MSGKSLAVRINWVTEEFGGRKHAAFNGMRPNVRWQRHVDEWLNGSWDAEIVGLDEGCQTTDAVLQFSDEAEVPADLEIPGELFELLDGYRVIGVGRVTGSEAE
jgi:hypothetical protein